MITQDFAETAALAATALLPDEDGFSKHTSMSLQDIHVLINLLVAETTQTIQLGADLLPKTSKCRC